jgi:hypothetical protein
MTTPDDSPVLFSESGSSFWPLLWGPIFAAVGAGLEATTGRVHGLAWPLVGIGLAGVAAVWVSSRRRLLSVRLTTTTLTQGQEVLAVDRIAEVDEVGTPAGARVLGGGWTVPRKYADVPVRLSDGTVVLAWARDGEGLRDALHGLVAPRPEVE